VGVPLVVCQLGLIRGDRVAARLVLSVRLPGRRLDVSWSVGRCRCCFAGSQRVLPSSHPERTRVLIWRRSFTEPYSKDRFPGVPRMSGLQVRVGVVFTLVVAGAFLFLASCGGGNSSSNSASGIPTLQIVTQSLPSGTQLASYDATLSAAGGVAPYSWLITAGSLPTGLGLGVGTGVISGMPTATGTSSFTAQVTDSESPPRAVRPRRASLSCHRFRSQRNPCLPARSSRPIVRRSLRLEAWRHIPG